MWVAGAGCITCGRSKLFDPSKSSSFSPKPGTAFSIGYSTGVDADPLPGGSASVPGKWVTDDVGIGNITVKGQQFVLASAYPPFLRDVPFDGVMGVGRIGYTQTPNDKPWYWYLFDDEHLSQSKISVFYPPGQVNGAEVAICRVNPARHTGPIHYMPLSSRFASRYTVDQTALSINGKAFRSEVQNVTVLDTGTAFVSATNRTVASIYAQISPKISQIEEGGVWGGPCDIIDAVVAPDITLSFGKGCNAHDVTIPKTAFNLGPYKGSNTTCQALFLGLGLFNSKDDEYETWLVGAPLLRQYYTVWDGYAGIIGFGTPVFN